VASRLDHFQGFLTATSHERRQHGLLVAGAAQASTLSGAKASDKGER